MSLFRLKSSKSTPESGKMVKKELHLKDAALCLFIYIPKEIPMDLAVSTSSPVGLTFFDFLPMTFSRES